MPAYARVRPRPYNALMGQQAIGNTIYPSAPRQRQTQWNSQGLAPTNYGAATGGAIRPPQMGGAASALMGQQPRPQPYQQRSLGDMNQTQGPASLGQQPPGLQNIGGARGGWFNPSASGGGQQPNYTSTQGANPQGYYGSAAQDLARVGGPSEAARGGYQGAQIEAMRQQPPGLQNIGGARGGWFNPSASGGGVQAPPSDGMRGGLQGAQIAAMQQQQQKPGTGYWNAQGTARPEAGMAYGRGPESLMGTAQSSGAQAPTSQFGSAANNFAAINGYSPAYMAERNQQGTGPAGYQQFQNNTSPENLDRGRGVDPSNTDPAYWQSIAEAGDIGLQESARRRGAYQTGYDPYQQANRENGGEGAYSAYGGSQGLAALFGGAGGGYGGGGQQQQQQYGRQQYGGTSQQQYGGQQDPYSQFFSGGGGQNPNQYRYRDEVGDTTQEQLPPGTDPNNPNLDFLNPILDRFDQPVNQPQTPGSISGLQGDIAGQLQRYLAGGGGSADIQWGSQGLRNLGNQFDPNMIARAGAPIQGRNYDNLLGNAPGLSQQGNAEYVQSLMSGGAGDSRNNPYRNQSYRTLGNSTDYLLGGNALSTFGPSTYDPATGRSSSGTLDDISQGQYADILMGRNQPANTSGMNEAIAAQLRNSGMNQDQINSSLGSFMGGPAWDILSKNFGGNVGTEMDRSQQAVSRATDMAGRIGGQAGNVGLPGETSEAAALARLLGQQGGNVRDVAAGGNQDLEQASQRARQLNQQGGISQNLNSFLESGLQGTGLPQEYVDAYSRQVYEPQREKLLGSLAQRGILDSGQRVKEEGDLLNQTFNDELMLKSLDQRNRTADQSLQAAGLGQNATQMLGGFGQQGRSAQMTADLANQDASLRGAGLLGANLGRGAELLMGAGDRRTGLADQNFQQQMQSAGLFGQQGQQAYDRSAGNARLPSELLMGAIDRQQAGNRDSFQNASSGYGNVTGNLANILRDASGSGQNARQLRNQEYGLGLEGYRQQSDDANRADDRATGAGLQLQQLLNQQYGLGLQGQNMNNQVSSGNRDALMQLLGLQSGIYGDTRQFGFQGTNAGYQNANDLINAQLNKEAGIYSADQNRAAGRNSGIGAAIGGIGAALIPLLFSSEQFKEDISQIEPEEALAKVLDAPLYRFKYKRGIGIDDSGKEHVGIILEDSDPAFSTPDGKRIDVDVIGLMMGAIQAQARQIAALTAKLAEVSR